MSLLEMSVSGGILILAITVVRALALHRVPKRTFLVLWAVAVLRLLVPFSLPSVLSIYTLADNLLPAAEETVPAVGNFPAAAPGPEVTIPAVPVPEVPVGEGKITLGWSEVWFVGMVLCAGWFLAVYIRCQREFRTAIPIEDKRLMDILARCRTRRTVTLRQSDRVAAPLTYGVLHPVILLPSNMDWSEEARMNCVLEHELTHIRRFDALAKLVLAATVCVHWFNPLVWCMYILANRDIELSCDEAVVGRLGVDRRSEYAMALITMEERKSGLDPFASAFSKNAIEERITAVMKMKKRSIAAVIAAIALICVVSAAFATSAAAKTTKPKPNVEDGSFTEAEIERLSSLWFEGYQDMTVADYQKKMWAEWSSPEDIELIERYTQSRVMKIYWQDEAATAEANAFDDYFMFVYRHLTTPWQSSKFWGVVNNGDIVLDYMYTLVVNDSNALTVGEYEQAPRALKDCLQALVDSCNGRMSQKELQTLIDAGTKDISRELSSNSLGISFLTVNWHRLLPPDVSLGTEDEELHAQFSSEVAAEWDRLLRPYVDFGLTYVFDDLDHDGNGLTMWFDGREARGIFDEQRGWITEHTGISAYAADAVELYAVYTDGELTGLRLATPKEQAAFDESRTQARFSS